VNHVDFWKPIFLIADMLISKSMIDFLPCFGCLKTSNA